MIVSLIIPAIRWDDHLDRTIRSISDQALDGGLEAETVVALASLEGPSLPPPSVRVVANPEGTAPAGLNHALEVARGDIVVRVDSRCSLPPGYVSRVVDLLADPKVGCAGGGQVVLDTGILGSAYATAFNSPMLGTGWYRWRSCSGETDTVYLGGWRRTDLDRVGRFDEKLVINQDSELAQRIHDAGLLVWYEGSLAVGYLAARSWRGLVRHHFDFGLWRAMRKRAGHRGYERRHLAVMAAGLLLAAAVVAWLASGPGLMELLVMAGLFVLVAIGAGASAARMRRKIPDPPRLNPIGVLLSPALAALLTASWAAGMVVGLARGGAALAEANPEEG